MMAICVLSKAYTDKNIAADSFIFEIYTQIIINLIKAIGKPWKAFIIFSLITHQPQGIMGNNYYHKIPLNQGYLDM